MIWSRSRNSHMLHVGDVHMGSEPWRSRVRVFASAVAGMYKYSPEKLVRYGAIPPENWNSYQDVKQLGAMFSDLR